MANIIDDLKWRYTTKAYDPSKKISDADFNILLESLILAPTSINSQPSHYFYTSSEEGKKKIAKATEGVYPMNTPKILDASHVIVFTTKNSYSREDVVKLVTTEQKSGRIPADQQEEFVSGKESFINMHKYDWKDLPHWLSKQTYITSGVLYTVAAILKIDTTPIEGIDIARLNKEFDLPSKGLSADFVVSLGYRDQSDENAKFGKTRYNLAEKTTKF